ncbi:hypothetical protein BANRA_00008 [Klebsiella pneumoniae]|nr:hypothetical protein BANRA_00008 [Klebsiella pneumoniae]
MVYRLDPATLDVTQIIHNDLKPFGATINHATGTLWFGNTVDSTVTAIDAKTGAVKAPVLDERQRSETVRPLQPRELAVNEQTNTVYITGLGKECDLGGRWRNPEAENDHYRHRGNGDGSGDRSAGCVCIPPTPMANC